MSDQGTAGGGGGPTGPTGFESQMLASQPQSMEDLVAQAIPGSSGLQGVCIFVATSTITTTASLFLYIIDGR